MRKFTAMLLCLAWGGLAHAQDPNAGVIFFQLREFNIPFKNDPTNLNVAEVRLHVSRDQGKTWQMTASAAPDGKQFRFATPQDGLFWFAVQTIYKDGSAYPKTAEDFRANLKVIVDTAPPAVQVKALPARPGEVGVSWNVTDDNLDLALPDAVRVEYRVVGAASWLSVPIVGGANQVYWNPQTNAQVEVRVLARDRASNLGEQRTTVSLAGGAAVPNFGNPIVGGPDQFKDIDRKFVNNKQVSLRYDLKDVGPSGVSAIELWYTLYKGRAWTKLAEYPIDLKDPLDADQTKKLTFEVTDEGIYGITLVAKSGVGLGDRPPQPGERPQFWLEVDLTKPIVQILDVHVGNGIDKGKLTVSWNARDKNLGATPIRLSYAESREGPWNTFADKHANTGKHVWRMPDGLPYQFYVRVEAFDAAGNVGEAVTLEKIKVDLSLPKAKIVDVAPGGR